MVYQRRRRHASEQRRLPAFGAESLADIGGWPAVLGRLAAREDLTSVESAAALREILDGAATSSQIAAFIFGLRCKGETAEELTGMLEAMLEVAETVPVAERPGPAAGGHVRYGRGPGRHHQCLDHRGPGRRGRRSPGVQARWASGVVAHRVG